MTEELKPLSKKHALFVAEYLKCFNGTQAYMLVYPKSGYDSARATSCGLLAKPNIRAEIEKYKNASLMQADEAFKLTSDIARGDVSEFITSLGALDIDALRKSGKGRLIKKIKQRTVTKIGKKDDDEDVEVHDTEIEFYDAQAAQRDILKVHGKFTDKVDVTSGGERIEPKDDNARFDRAISTLADALREIIPAKGDGQNSKVDTAK